MKSSVVVIGDGWAAMGAVAFLAQAGGQDQKITWVSGTGTRWVSPLPSVEVGEELRAVEVWKELATRFDLFSGEPQTGSYLREFRNKSFREPVWTKAPTLQARQESLKESLWAPECRFVPLFEARFPLTLFEIESQVRERLMSDEFPQIKRLDEVPVVSFKIEDGKIRSVLLGSGDEIRCDRVIFADRWNTVSQIQGLPKGLGLTRKREPMSILQAVFTHESPVGVGLQEGFFGTLHRESGENEDKHIWGYFSADGMQSVWTLALAGEEVEDNHLIGKKLRRMRGALEKMFTGEGWLPAGKTDFMGLVKNEQVRFEEASLFADGARVLEPVHFPKVEGLSFLTDGYGPSCAFQQLGTELGLWAEFDARQAQAQSEGVNLTDAATL